MKKIAIILLMIAILPLSVVNAKSTKRNFKKFIKTELTTASDSINYAMGYATGVQNRYDELKDDTLNTKKTASFCMGIESAYKEKDAVSNARINGYAIAQSIKSIADGDRGQLIPVDGFKLNIDTLSKGLINAITKNTKDFDFEKYSTFVNENVFTPLQNGKSINLTQSMTDSISLLFGYLNGTNVLQQMVKADTNPDLIKTLTDSYNDYIYSKDKINSYNKGEMVGHMLWEQIGDLQNFFESEKFAVNKSMFLNGLFDGVMQNPMSPLDFEQSKNYLDSVNQKIQHDRIAEQERLATEAAMKSQEEGYAFLQNNRMRPEVTTTNSGLQYEIVKQGEGPKPTESSTVKVHYEGKLLDGTVFDSSIKRGEPIEFIPTQVIKGWTEGLQLMPVGSKYIFYIPYNLAYGPNGAGGVIPPYATLIFEVELLEIVNNE